ncbi:arylsulfatase [Brachybacterium sp. P6-10-X1]|uniref:arylsulfatase n=1 Tax=Brachybacterium sp. P6-10-X1 TaxID=1903186 RepID=UPI000971966B|nr:arylsulfatase [Brachybacterium sp. P6-10-X1]APX31690.1 arylsulfatase [Brachybacterium sp. P6-10-X1]
MSEHPIAGRATVGTTYRDSEPWWPEAARPAAESPDVIMIVLDDVGFGSLGCFGSEIATPTMDGLAASGLTYTNFHVTPLCSPTRASLLTGRNHHAVGMSMLSNADSGYPGKRGAVSPRAAMVQELLRDRGYNTAAFGKWHLTPMDQTSSAGPYDQWPLGRGFDQHYGFLEGLTDHFFPELVQDNHRVDPPASPEEGYHLTDDLVDHLIDYISDHKSVAPHKPYFAYLALGAAHCPHQSHAEYLDRVRGRYEEGWDVVRERRLQRQIELGIVPEGTALAPRNDGVQPWDDLSPDEQRVMARLQEAFAAMLEHTDDQLERLIAHLEHLGVHDNTLILLMSDNGASQEGGPDGTTNTIAYENGDPVQLEDALAQIEDIGTWRCHSNYPWGWAQVGNTPLKRYKQNVHAGGVRAPLIVSWPRRLAEVAGERRNQFHDVIDIAPTILDVVGIEPPEEHRGVPQLPVHGVSMQYSFVDGTAPTSHPTQYFEMYGHRAIVHEGWKAVAYHERHTSYSADRWELYNLAEDFSECHDLAAERPEILHELIGRWWSEADRHGVFPLDDRNFAERAAKYHSAASPRRRNHFVLHRGVGRIPAGVTPLIYDRSHRIEATVDTAGNDEGVLISQGDVNGGYVLWLADRELHYEYNHQGTRRHAAGPAILDNGRHLLAMHFTRTGTLQGAVELRVDGMPVGGVHLPSTARYMLSWQGLEIGRDALSPVSDRYPRPFPFTGQLEKVELTLADDGGDGTYHEVID